MAITEAGQEVALRVLKVVLGVGVGAVVGTIGGFIALGLQLSREHPGVMIGIEPTALWRAPVFWMAFVPSVGVFTYLFSRIGRGKRPAGL